MTEVVNVRTSEGWDVYIGRQGRGEVGYFGNPYTAKKHGRGYAIDLFREYFYNRIAWDSEFKDNVENLRGKRLACFCKPAPCHGDIIKEYLDGTI